MIKAGKDLAELPAIGRDLAGKITEMVKTGHLAALEEAESELPASLVELSRIPGLGPKRVKLLYDRLGITGLPSLAMALEAGKLSKLSGFGEKLQVKIREAAAHRASAPQRWRNAIVAEAAENLIAYLKADRRIVEAEAAGSLRRRRDTVGDLDIVAISRRPEAAIERFVSYPGIGKVLAKGPTRSTAVLHSGLQVDIRVVAAESYGAVEAVAAKFRRTWR